MANVYVTIEVRRKADGPVRSTSHSMRETWENARKEVEQECQHYNSTGWFVSWRIYENGVHSDAGESKPLSIAAFRELVKQHGLRAKEADFGTNYDILLDRDPLFSVSRKQAKCGSYMEAILKTALRPEYIPPLG